MARYKPIYEEVEALQYDGTAQLAEKFALAMFTNVFPERGAPTEEDPVGWTGNMIVVTEDGTQQVVAPSDWIITRLDNTRYRLSNAEFSANYILIPET